MTAAELQRMVSQYRHTEADLRYLRSKMEENPLPRLYITCRGSDVDLSIDQDVAYKMMRDEIERLDTLAATLATQLHIERGDN